MSAYAIKQGDLQPPLELTLTDYTDRPIDLSERQVEVVIGRLGKPPIVRAMAEAFDPEAGTARYAWQPGETDVPGTYFLEVRLIDGNGEVMTIPSGGYGLIHILPSLST